MSKVPAAVVYLERPDGRVLALTRGQDFADWHLPGGKWEPRDGGQIATVAEPPKAIHDLQATAIRETQEETGVWLACANLRPLHDYVTRSGRPVRLFVVDGCTWWPERFGAYPAGQPAWVPPHMLTMPWCSFAHEARIVLDAVVRDREARQAYAAEDWVP
jgi:8-oxo-dGTP pyrophosphatase MutT (NUDIX family)